MLLIFFKFNIKTHLIVLIRQAIKYGEILTLNILYHLITDFMLHKLFVNTEVLEVKSYHGQMNFFSLCNVCCFLEIMNIFVHVRVMYDSHFYLFSRALNSHSY